MVGGCAWWGMHAWQGGMHEGVHSRGHTWWAMHVWQGDMHDRGHAWLGACVAGKTATAADGTHPTGMHSCDPCVCVGASPEIP